MKPIAGIVAHCHDDAGTSQLSKTEEGALREVVEDTAEH